MDSTHDSRDQHGIQQTVENRTAEQPESAPQIPLNLPEISTGPDLSDILGSQSVSTPITQKRASNVQKLAEENEKLNDELRAMTERLEAAERKRAELESARKSRQQAFSEKE